MERGRHPADGEGRAVAARGLGGLVPHGRREAGGEARPDEGAGGEGEFHAARNHRGPGYQRPARRQVIRVPLRPSRALSRTRPRSGARLGIGLGLGMLIGGEGRVSWTRHACSPRHDRPRAPSSPPPSLAALAPGCGGAPAAPATPRVEPLRPERPRRVRAPDRRGARGARSARARRRLRRGARRARRRRPVGEALPRPRQAPDRGPPPEGGARRGAGQLGRRRVMDGAFLANGDVARGMRGSLPGAPRARRDRPRRSAPRDGRPPPATSRSSACAAGPSPSSSRAIRSRPSWAACARCCAATRAQRLRVADSPPRRRSGPRSRRRARPGTWTRRAPRRSSRRCSTRAALARDGAPRPLRAPAPRRGAASCSTRRRRRPPQAPRPARRGRRRSGAGPRVDALRGLPAGRHRQGPAQGVGGARPRGAARRSPRRGGRTSPPCSRARATATPGAPRRWRARAISSSRPASRARSPATSPRRPQPGSSRCDAWLARYEAMVGLRRADPHGLVLPAVDPLPARRGARALRERARPSTSRVTELGLAHLGGHEGAARRVPRALPRRRAASAWRRARASTPTTELRQALVALAEGSRTGADRGGEGRGGAARRPLHGRDRRASRTRPRSRRRTSSRSRGAATARLKGDFLQKTGWGVALLYAIDAVYRLAAGQAPNLGLLLRADRARARRPDASSTRRSPRSPPPPRATPRSRRSTSSTRALAPDRFPKERRAAWDGLRAALAGLGAPGEAPAERARRRDHAHRRARRHALLGARRERAQAPAAGRARAPPRRPPCRSTRRPGAPSPGSATCAAASCSTRATGEATGSGSGACACSSQCSRTRWTSRSGATPASTRPSRCRPPTPRRRSRTRCASWIERAITEAVVGGYGLFRQATAPGGPHAGPREGAATICGASPPGSPRCSGARRSAARGR